MTVGESILYHRRRLSLTQAQLAGRIGVSAQAVSKWETGGGMPDISLIAPIARALGTTTDELLRFGERYQEMERRWKDALQEFGDDPKKLLEVSLAALKVFPYDWTFLYRTAVNQWRMSSATTDPAERLEILGRAMANAQLLYDQDSRNESAIWILGEVKKEWEKINKNKREA